MNDWFNRKLEVLVEIAREDGKAMTTKPESETPETDAAELTFSYPPQIPNANGKWNEIKNGMVHAHFARSLERRLREAEAQAMDWKRRFDAAMNRAEAAERERDELRAEKALGRMLDEYDEPKEKP